MVGFVGYAWFDASSAMLQRIRRNSKRRKEDHEMTKNLKVAPKPLVLVPVCGVIGCVGALAEHSDDIAFVRLEGVSCRREGDKGVMIRADRSCPRTRPNRSRERKELESYIKYAQEDATRGM